MWNITLITTSLSESEIYKKKQLYSSCGGDWKVEILKKKWRKPQRGVIKGKFETDEEFLHYLKFFGFHQQYEWCEGEEIGSVKRKLGFSLGY
ncbi:MAG: hypothetical protein CL666_10415 [Balneola sp.]|nr:hypothetical protein [Balneola sp.]|tara:strand:- start:18070 stop:18345 length:276 start_codon:yes stop_codon:yes gene_type:complete